MIEPLLFTSTLLLGKEMFTQTITTTTNNIYSGIDKLLKNDNIEFKKICEELDIHIKLDIINTFIIDIHNSDTNHGVYNTKLGIYEENCGLDQVYCSWGHDEYLYQVLKHNQCPLPEEALYIIRFHSLYSYHKNDEYQHLTNEKDKEMFKWLKLFNQYDLYTKSDNIDINDETKKYYQVLIKKYLRNGILWF